MSVPILINCFHNVFAFRCYFCSIALCDSCTFKTILPFYTRFENIDRCPFCNELLAPEVLPRLHLLILNWQSSEYPLSMLKDVQNSPYI